MAAALSLPMRVACVLNSLLYYMNLRIVRKFAISRLNHEQPSLLLEVGFTA